MKNCNENRESLYSADKLSENDIFEKWGIT